MFNGGKRGKTPKSSEYDSIDINMKIKQKQLMVLRVQIVIPQVSVLGVGLVTKGEAWGGLDATDLIWKIFTKCVYFVQICQAIHLFVQFSVGIMSFNFFLKILYIHR